MGLSTSCNTANKLSALTSCISTKYRQLASDDIFKDSKTVIIQHSGKEYRLCITSKDKLILIK